jgi:cell division protein FtsQ
MVNYYKKYQRIRKKKSIFKNLFKNRFFWLFVLTGCIISLLIYFFFFSPFFSVKEIKIEGQLNFISEKEIKEFISEAIKGKVLFFKSTSIFSFRRKKIEKLALKHFFSVKDIKIKRKFPDVLIVEISERKPVVNFCQENGCFFVDEEGIIFHKSNLKMTVLRTEKKEARLGEKVVEKNLLKKALKIADSLKKEISIEVKEIYLTPFKIEMTTEKGITLIFSPQKGLNEQIEDLKLIIEKQITQERLENVDYIDLRFDKIFYKLKDDFI